MRPSSTHHSPTSAWGTCWVTMPAMLWSIPIYQHASSHCTQAEIGSKLSLRPVLPKSIPTVVEPIVTDWASEPTWWSCIEYVVLMTREQCVTGPFPVCYAKSLQSCPTLCDPMDCSPPSFPQFFCPWDSPGQNTRVVCCALLQGIFQSQGSNPYLLCLLHNSNSPRS